MFSDAIGLERVAAVIGYKLTKGDFRTTSPNLPQRIIVLAEANTANQEDLETTKKEIISAKDAGVAYGYGSPAHIMARILLPSTGGGVAGIPVIVIPQVTPEGAAAQVVTIEPTGTATANGTHTLIVAGRRGMEGSFYNINIVKGDGSAEITAKMTDAIMAILGCPYTADDDGYVTSFTSKWKGATANGLSISVDTNGNSLGIVYAIDIPTDGAGVPDIADSLAQIGNEWSPILLNPYDQNTDILDALEQFNGRPDPDNPSGRYTPIKMNPFIALFGSCAGDPSAITDARLEDCTNALCPTPFSKGLPMEGAANYGVLFANVSQNTPHLDVADMALPDMPTPQVIGPMSDYDNRDAFVKKGCSTADIRGGRFIVKDFVTTYHKEGENPPQYRYCRNLMLDYNVRYSYLLEEQINVVNHTIAKDGDMVSATKVVKPKQWKQILSNRFAKDLANRALIVDVPFTQDSIQVGIGTSNPDRFETFFRYKRSGFARQSATTAEAGFNFGTLEA